jgi:thiamine monophosphate kinase
LALIQVVALDFLRYENQLPEHPIESISKERDEFILAEHGGDDFQLCHTPKYDGGCFVVHVV